MANVSDPVYEQMAQGKDPSQIPIDLNYAKRYFGVGQNDFMDVNGNRLAPPNGGNMSLKDWQDWVVNNKAIIASSATGPGIPKYAVAGTKLYAGMDTSTIVGATNAYPGSKTTFNGQEIPNNTALTPEQIAANDAQQKQQEIYRQTILSQKQQGTYNPSAWQKDAQGNFMPAMAQTNSIPGALVNPANPPAAVLPPMAAPTPAPAANPTALRTPGTTGIVGSVPAPMQGTAISGTQANQPPAATFPAQANPLLRTPTTFPATPAALVNPATPPAAATPAAPTMMRTAAAPSPTPATNAGMILPQPAPIAANPTALRTTTVLPSVAPAMMQGTALTGTQAQQGGQLGNLTLPATGMTVPGIVPAVKMLGLTAAGQAQPNLAAQNAFLQTGMIKPAAPQFPALPQKRVAAPQPITGYRAPSAPVRKTVNMLG